MATALIAAQRTRTSTRSPLALWHLLSLDAPAVAAVWTVYVAHSFGVRLPWSAPAALALAVWMLYAADRLADAARGTHLQARHHFHQLHRYAFAGGIAGAVPVLAFLLMVMPHTLRLAWMLQALPLGAYIAAVHALRLPRVPKEILVGIFFGATCFMPALLVQPTAATVGAALLFGVLCWMNCAAIARWEDTSLTSVDAATAWAAAHLRIACIALAAIACGLLFEPHTRLIALPVLLSCLALLTLETAQMRLKRLHLRALADAALLTPLLTFPLLHALAR